METVEKYLVKPVAVVHCSHLSGVRVMWIEDRAGKPPHLAFQGFPAKGCVVMSVKTIVVACDRCQGMTSLMLQDHGLT